MRPGRNGLDFLFAISWHIGFYGVSTDLYVGLQVQSLAPSKQSHRVVAAAGRVKLDGRNLQRADPDRQGYLRGRFRLHGESLVAGVRRLLLGTEPVASPIKTAWSGRAAVTVRVSYSCGRTMGARWGR